MLALVSVSDWLSALSTLGTVLAILVATVIAYWQLQVQRKHSNVERTIYSHRDFTTGETGAARDRLSEFMWRAGSESGLNRCWQPTWEQLLGSEYIKSPADFVDLSKYPPDMKARSEETPLRDLYKILWSFERVGVAYHAGLLDKELSVSMLASHVIWWECLCERISADKTYYRKNLTKLANEFVQLKPTLLQWAKADFTHDNSDQSRK